MSRTAALFAVITMVSWGLWAVLAKVATESVVPELAMLVSYAVSVPVAIAYIGVRGVRISPTVDGLAVAALAGVFLGIAGLSFYAGVETGQTAIVATISGLYFVVAAILGVLFLGESIGVQEMAGIGCAIGAVVLLAG